MAVDWLMVGGRVVAGGWVGYWPSVDLVGGCVMAACWLLVTCWLMTGLLINSCSLVDGWLFVD